MMKARAMRNIVGQKLMSAAWRPVRDFFSGRKDAIQGIAAIEFAIIAPTLVLMAVATADLGLGIYRRMEVQNAAQYGSTFAAIHGFDATSITNAVTSSTTYGALTVDPAPNQFCGCASSSGIAAQACTAPCANGSPIGTYVTVSTQATYSTILHYPIIPSSFSFSSQATVRIQ